MKSRLIRITLVLALGAGIGVPWSAHADDVNATTFSFVGVVRDPLGRVMPGTTIMDQSAHRVSYTDEQGRFLHTVNNTLGGRFTLRAWRSDTTTTTQVVDVVVPSGEVPVDFVVKYRSWNMLSPRNIKTVPATVGVTVRAYAPVEGVCVDFTDERTGITSALVFSPTDGLWHGSFDLPAETEISLWSTNYVTYDCSSGTLLSSRADGMQYFVNVPDTRSPIVQLQMPLPGRRYVMGIDAGSSTSGRTTAIGQVSFGALVEDNWRIAEGTLRILRDGREVFTEVNSGNYGESSWTYVPDNLGSYDFEITFRDEAGNSTSVSGVFEVTAG